MCFRKLPVAKKILHKRWGVSKFSVERIFISECRTFRRVTIAVLCFRNVPVAKNTMDKRGGYQTFPSNFFCTTTPKTLAREPFCVVFQKTPGSE